MILSSSGKNLIFISFELHFPIILLISIIFLILFSIFKQSFILLIILLSSSSHSFSNIFPLSKYIFIWLGSFSPFLIISSLKYISSNLVSNSNNNLSSLSFTIFLIFVNIFDNSYKIKKCKVFLEESS